MAIQSDGITILDLTEVKSETASSWSIKFKRRGDRLQVALHWNDKLDATHETIVNYNEFVTLVTKI